MQIGIISGEYPPMQGGIGAFSQILARQMVALGHHVYIFSSREAQNRDKGILLTNQVDSWNLAAMRMIGTWARDLGLDIVNLQFQTAAFGMSAWIHFLPGYITTAPMITTFHDLRHPYLFPKAGALRDWIVMRLANHSDGVIVTNHEDFARLQNRPAITMIPIGSNISSEPHAARALDADTQRDGIQILHFGFINRTKGIETLLYALEHLRESGIKGYLTMLGGRVGASDPTNAGYVQQIENLISKLGLSEAIHWTDYLVDAEVSRFLNSADIVVLPFRDGASYRRGSLMAAIHHGCAIITTIPQLPIAAFQSEENMLLVPPNDPVALAQGIMRIHSDAALALRLREGALTLSAAFDWSEITAETLRFYETVIRGRA